VGYTSPDSKSGTSPYKPFIFKFDQSGTLLWSHEYSSLSISVTWPKKSAGGIAVSSDGKVYVVISSGAGALADYVDYIKVFDASTGAELGSQVLGHTNYIMAAALMLSEDEEYLYFPYTDADRYFCLEKYKIR
jgi:hypothetical protein